MKDTKEKYVIHVLIYKLEQDVEVSPSDQLVRKHVTAQIVCHSSFHDTALLLRRNDALRTSKTSPHILQKCGKVSRDRSPSSLAYLQVLLTVA